MKRTTEAVVGATILAGILVVVIGTIWLKGTVFGEEATVIEARFREVGQLQQGNPVVLRGVGIGRVSDIILEPGGEGVIVQMRIRDDVALPEEPVVILSPKSMFGDWQAEIHPRAQFMRYDYAQPRSGSMLPGYALPDMSRLTAVADRIAENLAVVTERVEIAFTEETALNIRRAIENIEAVSTELTKMVNAQQQTLDAVAENLQATTRSLGDAAETVRRAFEQVETALDEGQLNAIIDNVRSSAENVDAVTASLAEMSDELREILTTAESAFSTLDEVARRINAGDGTLGQLLQDPDLYGDIVETNLQLRQLLEDIRENPRRYINIRLF
ncbi:MAG TPA: MlaD family protein [Longimicrobiales bacterium]|nr:MlaD family protein [Longimicrobiales bacterium]